MAKQKALQAMVLRLHHDRCHNCDISVRLCADQWDERPVQQTIH